MLLHVINAPKCGITIRRVSRGGGGVQGAWTPLEIEKQKKTVIRANFKLFRLCFATFSVENIIFSSMF